jgi:NTP pyrophosphatase (non-canonical NTP hydrolase)
MEIKEFQKKCADIVDTIDKTFNVTRDAQLSFTQLVEEVGELAKDINLKRLRNKEPDRENFEGEFADVFLQLAMLAQMHGVDIEKAVNKKVEILKDRGYLK